MKVAEFLADLRELSRRYGWSGDYTEVQTFVCWVHRELGIDPCGLDLTPYEETQPRPEG